MTSQAAPVVAAARPRLVPSSPVRPGEVKRLLRRVETVQRELEQAAHLRHGRGELIAGQGIVPLGPPFWAAARVTASTARASRHSVT